MAPGGDPGNRGSCHSHRWVPAGKGWPPARGLSGVGTGPVGGRGDWRGADITAGGSGAVGAGRTETLRTGASGKWRLGVGKGGGPGGIWGAGGVGLHVGCFPPFSWPQLLWLLGVGAFRCADRGLGAPVDVLGSAVGWGLLSLL